MSTEQIFQLMDTFRHRAHQRFSSDYLKQTNISRSDMSTSYCTSSLGAFFAIEIHVGREGYDWRGFSRILKWQLWVELNYANEKPFIATKSQVLANVYPMNEKGVKPNSQEALVIHKIPRFRFIEPSDFSSYLPELDALFIETLDHITSFNNVNEMYEFHKSTFNGQEVPPENLPKE